MHDSLLRAVVVNLYRRRMRQHRLKERTPQRQKQRRESLMGDTIMCCSCCSSARAFKFLRNNAFFSTRPYAHDRLDQASVESKTPATYAT